MADTLVRMCDSCGLVDDHPRHVFGVGPDHGNPTSSDVAQKALKDAGDDFDAVFTHLNDPLTQVKHLDCCMDDGCPDGSCDRISADTEVEIGTKKGDALRKQLNSDSVSKIGESLNEERAKRNQKSQEASE